MKVLYDQRNVLKPAMKVGTDYDNSSEGLYDLVIRSARIVGDVSMVRPHLAHVSLVTVLISFNEIIINTIKLYLL